MPENTADFDIPKPLDTDKPASMEQAVGPGFDRVDELFGAIDLSQLVVPAESDGKLLIVKDGAAAYRAMKGDATIDEDGNLQFGAGVVGTNELANLGVTAAKVDNATLGPSKFTAEVVNALTDARVPVDGSVTRKKLAKPYFEGHVNEKGEVVSGEGFSAERTATGKFTIKLTEEQASKLMVVAIAVSALEAVKVTLQEDPTKKEFKVLVWNAANALANWGFQFTAIPA